MPATWPVALQSKLNEAGFDFNIGNTTISSEPDIGPLKIRRRFTRGIATIGCSIYINKTDVQTFYDFYNTTLNGGINSFNFLDPFTNTTKEYKFDPSKPPSISPVGGEVMNLTMSWRTVP